MAHPIAKTIWVIGQNKAIRASMMISLLVLIMAGALRADDVVTHWNKVMLATIANGGTDPVVSTRVTAIVQTAVFDSVNGIRHKYIAIHANLPAPQGASVPAAVIASAYTTLVALYPAQLQALRMERNASLAKLQASASAITLGRRYGASVAMNILAWRRRRKSAGPLYRAAKTGNFL